MSVSNSTTPAPLKEGAILAEQMAQHEGLVRWVVRQQWLGDLPFNDALHEGRLGLWAALRHYDPGRGTAFSTYAVPAIARAVWRAVEFHHRCSSPAYLSSSQDVDLVELVHRAQVRSALLELVDHLPPRLRQVIVAHYGLANTPPQTFVAIGRTMALTRQRVHQLHGKALLWLAQPAYSLPLRRLLERHSRADYSQSLAKQRTAARQRRQAGRK